MQSIIKSIRSIGFLTIALTLALAANFAYGQWANPTAAPAGGNVAPPVHTGAGTQTKAGNFGAATMLAADHMRSPAYCDENGAGADNVPFTADDACFATSDVGGGGISCDEGEIMVTRGGIWVCEPLATPPTTPVQVDRRWDESAGWRIADHGRYIRNVPMNNFQLSDTVNYYRLTANTSIGCEQRGCDHLESDPRMYCYPQVNENGSWTTVGPVRSASLSGGIQYTFPYTLQNEISEVIHTVNSAGGVYYYKPVGGNMFQRVAEPRAGANEIGAPIEINENNFLRLSAGDGDDYNCNYSFEFRVID